MKKAIFTLAIASLYLVACNESTSDDHGHDHPHGEHGDHEHHDGDDDHHHDHDEEHYEQEEFVVESDSTVVPDHDANHDDAHEHDHDHGDHSH